MSKVLVVYASRHGGTAGISQRIAQTLEADGLEAVVADAADRPDPTRFDACVIGSGVYIGSWLKEGLEFLDRNQATLAKMPVWLFSSGPLPGSSKETDTHDPLARALGPTEGPGSAGRRKVAGLSDAIGVRAHHVFLGAFNPNDPPKSMQERLVRVLPAAKRILPEGDFREWEAIETWAHTIAAALAVAPAPVR